MTVPCRSHCRPPDSGRRLLALLLWCVLLWPCAPLQANEPLVFDKPPHGVTVLNPWLSYFDPGLQHYQADDVTALHESQWKPVAELPFMTVMGPRRVLWFRLHLHNPLPHPLALVFENTNPMTDEWKLYYHSVSLSREPHHHGPLLVQPNEITDTGIQGTLASPLLLPANSSLQLYMMSRGFHGAAQPFSLSPANGFAQKQYDRQFELGMIDGILIGLILYNLLLWATVRKGMYGAFIVLGLANLASNAIQQNLFSALSPNVGNTWRTDAAGSIPLLVSMALAFFAQVYLNTRTQHPRTHRLLNLYIVFTLGVCIAFLLGTPIIVTTPLFTLASAASLVAMLLACWQNPDLPLTQRTLLTVAFSMPVVSALLTVISSAGTNPVEREYASLLQLTDAIEMFALSLAMGSKLKWLEAEKDRQIHASRERDVARETQSRMLAHLNHEFRTPLNGILGGAELLLDSTEADQREVVETIYKTTIPLKHLIDDLIDVKAISQNEKSLVLQNVALADLLQECLEIFHPLARQRQLALFITLDRHTSRRIVTDQYRLRQILLNLLGNAFKFTRSGEIGVSVSGEPNPSGEECLYHFDIMDTGPGIRPEQQEQLFESFVQQSREDAQHGTGLGLSIVQELSRRLGGDCGYNALPASAAGTGSIFWFTARVTPQAVTTSTALHGVRGRHVLLAHANWGVRSWLERRLLEQHAIAQTAADSDSLLARARESAYDLVLLDERLYRALGDSGVATLLRTLPGARFVVLLERFAGTGHLALPAPFESLPRPILLEQLLDDLDHLLTQGQSGATTSTPATGLPLRVLACEDTTENQLILSAILDGLGVPYDLCNNGREAFERYLGARAANTPYDVILMDCEMPVQDGFITALQIRDHETLYDLPRTAIAALTAHTEPEYRIRSIQSGMDAYLTKPFTADTIRHYLAELAGGAP